MSCYSTMWLVVMFDMPTQTPKERKRYQWFHKELQKEGYFMMQYSVYAKVFASIETARNGQKKISSFVKKNIKKGNIRMMQFTDKQFGDMELIVGEVPQREQEAHEQLLLFTDEDE